MHTPTDVQLLQSFESSDPTLIVIDNFCSSLCGTRCAVLRGSASEMPAIRCLIPLRLLRKPFMQRIRGRETTRRISLKQIPDEGYWEKFRFKRGEDHPRTRNWT